MTYTAIIEVMPLTELLDPQGKAVLESLHRLNNQNIQDVRIGKSIFLKVEATNKEEAMEIAEKACKEMLYNPVMEQYSIHIQS